MQLRKYSQQTINDYKPQTYFEELNVRSRKLKRAFKNMPLEKVIKGQIRGKWERINYINFRTKSEKV